MPDLTPDAIAADLRLDIDLDRLDEEWVRQPGLYHKYAAKAVDAKDAVNRAKAKLEAVSAELALDIRERPEEFRCPKATEKAVEACVLLQPQYKKALKALHDALYAHDFYEAAVRTLDQRKRTLESLVTLHANDYFAEPRAPKNARRQMDDSSRQAVGRRVIARQTEKA